ncbi:hypothetical protein ANN_02319 [Periplaneta americana]|uniref:Uncharacterized protein n=1 Tax=Periplaneta americana TaxID=6978 RepID=A0ABQ8TYF4_PERAM|nr:hypothetical protein ANN_02319 [Periplaneta americana]
MGRSVLLNELLKEAGATAQLSYRTLGVPCSAERCRKFRKQELNERFCHCDVVYVPPILTTLPELRKRISTIIEKKKCFREFGENGSKVVAVKGDIKRALEVHSEEKVTPVLCRRYCDMYSNQEKIHDGTLRLTRRGNSDNVQIGRHLIHRLCEYGKFNSKMAQLLGLHAHLI